MHPYLSSYLKLQWAGFYVITISCPLLLLWCARFLREKKVKITGLVKVNVRHTIKQNNKITYSKNNNWSVSFCFFWPHGFFVKQDQHDFNKFLWIHTLSLCTYITIPISFGKYTMIPLYMCFISCFYFLRMHPICMHHTKHAKDIWMITMQYMYFQNTCEKHSYHNEIH